MCGNAIERQPADLCDSATDDADEFAATVALRTDLGRADTEMPTEMPAAADGAGDDVSRATPPDDSEWLLPAPSLWQRYAGKAGLGLAAVALVIATWTVARTTDDAPGAHDGQSPTVASDLAPGSERSPVGHEFIAAPAHKRAANPAVVHGRMPRVTGKRSRRSRRAARRSAASATPTAAPAALPADTPASTGDADARAKIDAAVAALTGSGPDIVGKPASESAPQPTVEPAPEPAAEPAPEPVAEPAPEPAAEPAPEPAAEPVAELAPAPESAPLADGDADAPAGPAEAEAAAEPGSAPADAPDATPEGDAEPAPEAQPEPAPAPGPKSAEPAEDPNKKRSAFFIKLGNAQLDQGNYSGAGVSFARALGLDPDSAAAKDGLKRARAGAP